MSRDEKPTIEGFKAFFGQYLEACSKGDAAFMRRILPPGIPEDELEFVRQSSKALAQSLHETKVDPEIVQDGTRFDAVFTLAEGGDTTEWRLDFYFSRGQWLKYDPESA